MSRRSKSSGWPLALAVFGLGAHASAQSPLLHSRDLEELVRLRQRSPQSLVLLEQGEALFRQGKLSDAEVLLAKAVAEAPDSFVTARRHCQVLVELGRRLAAQEACQLAMQAGHMAMDRRATVAALMTGPSAPNTTAVAEAVALSMSAKNLEGQPFGDAALCEIGYRLGDELMLKNCVTQLERIAPHHYETRRWSAVAARGGWRHWLVWSGAALAMAATATHAFWRRLSSRRRATAGARTVAAALALWLVALPSGAVAQEDPASAVGSASAGPAASAAPNEGQKPHERKTGVKWQLSKFPIDHDNPEGMLPTEVERNKEPLDFGYFLQDLASEGAYAERAGDFQAAVKYWRALAKTVPDNAMGFRRTCMAYENLKDRHNGLDFCRQALNSDGAMLEDYPRYVSMLLSKPGPLNAVEVGDFDVAMKHLREQPQSASWTLVADTLACEVGAVLQDVKRLETCTQALAKTSPDDLKTLSFQWSLAMLRKDYRQATTLLEKLKKTEIKPELLARMSAVTTSESRWWRPFLTDWRYGLGLLGFLIAALVVFLFRRRGSKPTVTTQAQAPTAAAPAP